MVKGCEYFRLLHQAAVELDTSCDVDICSLNALWMLAQCSQHLEIPARKSFCYALLGKYRI